MASILQKKISHVRVVVGFADLSEVANATFNPSLGQQQDFDFQNTPLLPYKLEYAERSRGMDISESKENWS